MSDSPEALCYEAEKCSAPRRFLSFFSGGPNYEEACDLYVKAANIYKLNKKWQNAYDTFQKAAEASQLAKDTFRQASLLVEAGHCAKKFSMPDASATYQKAEHLYNQGGRFNQSAKLMKTLAEMYEEAEDTQAIPFYKKAATYFDMDEFGKSQHSACLIKYAQLSSQKQNNIDEAITIFEAEAEKHLRNSLLQYSAKDHFFKAAILYILRGNIKDASTAITRYKQMDSRFDGSREEKLLQQILSALDEKDVEKYSTAVHDYDSIRRLDPWHIHFLYEIKRVIDPIDNGSAPITELAERYDHMATTEGNDLITDEIDLS